MCKRIQCSNTHLSHLTITVPSARMGVAARPRRSYRCPSFALTRLPTPPLNLHLPRSQRPCNIRTQPSLSRSRRPGKTTSSRLETHPQAGRPALADARSAPSALHVPRVRTPVNQVYRRGRTRKGHTGGLRPRHASDSGCVHLTPVGQEGHSSWRRTPRPRVPSCSSLCV